MAASPQQTQFALAVREWVERTKANADQACRAIALEIATRIILKSPVGNPELWKANAEAALQRSQHNVIVDQINAYLASDPANRTEKGNLRRRARSRANRRLSKSELAKAYPFRQGKGYVGGRLRGSWGVTIGTPSSADPNRIDPSGAQAIAAASAALAAFKAGPAIYITTNVPYAHRIEFESWSTQAPAGMVRVTLAEIDAIMAKAVRPLAT